MVSQRKRKSECKIEKVTERLMIVKRVRYTMESKRERGASGESERE